MWKATGEELVCKEGSVLGHGRVHMEDYVWFSRLNLKESMFQCMEFLYEIVVIPLLLPKGQTTDKLHDADILSDPRQDRGHEAKHGYSVIFDIKLQKMKLLELRQVGFVNKHMHRN